MAILPVISPSNDATIEIDPAQASVTALPSASDSSSIGSTSPPFERQRRKELIIFIRVLLEHLAHHDPQLRQAVRTVIIETIQENRNGNPCYQPLALSVQRRARAMAGERHWNRVESMIVCTKEKSRSKKKDLNPTKPVIAKSA